MHKTKRTFVHLLIKKTLTTNRFRNILILSTIKFLANLQDGKKNNGLVPLALNLPCISITLHPDDIPKTITWVIEVHHRIEMVLNLSDRSLLHYSKFSRSELTSSFHYQSATVLYDNLGETRTAYTSWQLDDWTRTTDLPDYTLFSLV